MRFRFSILCACVAIACVLASIATLAQTPTTSGTKPKKDSRPGFFVIDGLDTSDIVGFVPEIQVVDLDGLKKILQRDPKDTRPLLVNFWATWCDPCREEFPDLVKLDDDYKGKPL